MVLRGTRKSSTDADTSARTSLLQAVAPIRLELLRDSPRSLAPLAAPTTRRLHKSRILTDLIALVARVAPRRAALHRAGQRAGRAPSPASGGRRLPK